MICVQGSRHAGGWKQRRGRSVEEVLGLGSELEL